MLIIHRSRGWDSVTDNFFQKFPRPQLADKPSLRSSCVPAPLFESHPRLQSTTAAKLTLCGWYFVPGMGLEPIRDCSHDILSVACLPFHHPGLLLGFLLHPAFLISPSMCWLQTMAIWTENPQILNPIIMTVTIYVIEFDGDSTIF